MNENENIPVIFWHRGDSWYLRVALQQAEKYMNDIRLVGDERNKTFGSKWFDMDTLPVDKWKQFKSHYVNLSMNNAEFELRCFERYFYIREYCEREKIERFFLLDSDLLLYDNLGPYFDNVPRAFSRTERKTESWAVSPHCGLWNLDDIISFTEFLIEYYCDNVGILQRKFEEFKLQNTKGGICDMTLLYLWLENNQLTYQNTAISNGGGYCIDHAISVAANAVPNEYIMSRMTGCKKTYFYQGQPYFQKYDGTRVRALALHCSGGYKNYMPYLVKEKGDFTLFIVRLVKKLTGKM